MVHWTNTKNKALRIIKQKYWHLYLKKTTSADHHRKTMNGLIALYGAIQPVCEFTITDKRKAMGHAAFNQRTANHINEPGDAIALLQCVSWHEAAGVMLMQLPSNPSDYTFGTLPHYRKYIFCDKALFVSTTHPIVILQAVNSSLCRMLRISRRCASFIVWLCRVKGSMWCWIFKVWLLYIKF